jgi:hypothetical protein
VENANAAGLTLLTSEGERTSFEADGIDLTTWFSDGETVEFGRNQTAIGTQSWVRSVGAVVAAAKFEAQCDEVEAGCPELQGLAVSNTNVKASLGVGDWNLYCVGEGDCGSRVGGRMSRSVLFDDGQTATSVAPHQHIAFTDEIDVFHDSSCNCSMPLNSTSACRERQTSTMFVEVVVDLTE